MSMVDESIIHGYSNSQKIKIRSNSSWSLVNQLERNKCNIQVNRYSATFSVLASKVEKN